MYRFQWRRALSMACAGMLAVGSFSASAWTVSLDLHGLSDPPQPLQLAFDFIDGGAPSNTVVVSDLAMAGPGRFEEEFSFGGASGSHRTSLSFTDSTFLSGYLADFVAGPSLSFHLASTSNAPVGDSAPDSFAVYVLDRVTGASRVASTDPTGANALLRFDVTGVSGGRMSVFSVPSGEVLAVAVPEPQTVWLLIGGLAALGGRSVWRARRRQP